MFSVKPKSLRKTTIPVRYRNYWDMQISTEFYEEEFIEFEDFLEQTMKMKESSDENPHGKSEFSLREYEKFQKFVKGQNKKIFRRNRKLKERGQSKNIPECMPKHKRIQDKASIL